MGLIINTTDFVGKWALAQNTYSKLGDYITQFERNYLYKLLGKELADLFIADLSNYIPQTARFTTIYNPLNTEVSGLRYETDGMKAMMLGLVYFEYQRYERAKSTISGVSTLANENSREVGFGELNLYNRYNEGVVNFNTIQAYVRNDSTTYSEFDTDVCELGISHWSI